MKTYSFSDSRFVRFNKAGYVRQFALRFGKLSKFLETCQFVGMPVSRNTLNSWMDLNAMPESLYAALKEVLGQDGEEHDTADTLNLQNRVKASGDDIAFLEVYFKDVFVGRFELPAGIKVVARKRNQNI